MIDEPPANACRALIELLSEQLHLVRIAGHRVDRAFERATRVLTIAVLAGLALAVTLLFGTSDRSGPARPQGIEQSRRCS